MNYPDENQISHMISCLPLMTSLPITMDCELVIIDDNKDDFNPKKDNMPLKTIKIRVYPTVKQRRVLQYGNEHSQ